MVDQIRADATEQSITVTDGISDRWQLVTALKLLATWRVVTETDGTLTGWGERPEDEALLSINRPLLIHLLPSPLHHFGNGGRDLVPASAGGTPAAAPAAAGREPGGVPGRASRRRAGRAVPGTSRARPAPGRELRPGAGGPGRRRAGVRPIRRGRRADRSGLPRHRQRQAGGPAAATSPASATTAGRCG